MGLFELQQRKAMQEGTHDRSQDIRILQEYYKRYRAENRIDQLEAQAQFSTDLVPDRCIYVIFMLCSFNQ